MKQARREFEKELEMRKFGESGVGGEIRGWKGKLKLKQRETLQSAPE